MRLRVLAAVFATGLVLGISPAASRGTQFIVVLNDGNSIAAVNQAHGTSTLRHIDGTSIYLVQANTSGDNSAILSQFANDSAVATAETNDHVQLRSPAQAALAPSLAEGMAVLLDGTTLTTFYGTTVLKSYVNQPALRLTHVSDVRRISTGAGTHIAYIDTGVDFYHPALQPWLDPGINVLDNGTVSELDGLSSAGASLLDGQMAQLLDAQGWSLLDNCFTFVLDAGMASLLDGSGTLPKDLGHGTMVAGILHLVAPGARIVPIKAFTADGNTTMYALTEAVYRATQMRVDVLNMSFSTTEDSPAFHKAIKEAQAAGVTVVASAGNDATGTVTYYPAAYPNVIGVAATDFNDQLAGFSNYGVGVSVEAPGAYVVSTVPGGKYAAAWGTSFSAPMVSGEVALLASSRGHGHSNSRLVINTADSIDSLNPGFAGMLGKGRINALQALKFAK
jgi:subtilisin family serine protease